MQEMTAYRAAEMEKHLDRLLRTIKWIDANSGAQETHRVVDTVEGQHILLWSDGLEQPFKEYGMSVSSPDLREEFLYIFEEDKDPLERGVFDSVLFIMATYSYYNRSCYNFESIFGIKGSALKESLAKGNLQSCVDKGFHLLGIPVDIRQSGVELFRWHKRNRVTIDALPLEEASRREGGLAKKERSKSLNDAFSFYKGEVSRVYPKGWDPKTRIPNLTK